MSNGYLGNKPTYCIVDVDGEHTIELTGFDALTRLISYLQPGERIQQVIYRDVVSYTYLHKDDPIQLKLLETHDFTGRGTAYIVEAPKPLLTGRPDVVYFDDQVDALYRVTGVETQSWPNPPKKQIVFAKPIPAKDANE